MKFQVVFFTRTNTSKRIAEKISEKLSCDAIQITDNMNWKGIFGFIKAGYYSSTHKHVDIEVLGNLDTADEYIVVSPIWADGLAPAIITFLETLPKDKVHLVASSDGSQLKKRLGYKSVRDITKHDRNEDLIIDDLVNRLVKDQGIAMTKGVYSYHFRLRKKE